MERSRTRGKKGKGTERVETPASESPSPSESAPPSAAGAPSSRHKRARREEAAAAGGGGSSERAPWQGHAFGTSSAVPSSPLLRLHEEILDFAAFVAPTPAERCAAEAALASLVAVVAAVFPGAAVEVFGSRANGLVLPTSDWE